MPPSQKRDTTKRSSRNVGPVVKSYHGLVRSVAELRISDRPEMPNTNESNKKEGREEVKMDVDEVEAGGDEVKMDVDGAETGGDEVEMDVDEVVRSFAFMCWSLTTL